MAIDSKLSEFPNDISTDKNVYQLKETAEDFAASVIESAIDTAEEN